MAALSFVQIQSVDSWFCYFAAVVLIISTAIENVSIEVLFMRTMPGDVRGAMNGLFHLFGQFGLILFTYIGGVAFDEIGPWCPFFLVGCCDVVLMLVAITLVCLGKI